MPLGCLARTEHGTPPRPRPRTESKIRLESYFGGSVAPEGCWAIRKYI